LLFGLFLEKKDGLKQLKWIKKLNLANLKKEVEKLNELTILGAFSVRTLFLLLFDYLIQNIKILRSET
jgi:hypothetical protein